MVSQELEVLLVPEGLQEYYLEFLEPEEFLEELVSLEQVVLLAMMDLRVSASYVCY